MFTETGLGSSEWASCVHRNRVKLQRVGLLCSCATLPFYLSVRSVYFVLQSFFSLTSLVDHSHLTSISTVRIVIHTSLLPHANFTRTLLALHSKKNVNVIICLPTKHLGALKLVQTCWCPPDLIGTWKCSKLNRVLLCFYLPRTSLVLYSFFDSYFARFSLVIRSYPTRTLPVVLHSYLYKYTSLVTEPRSGKEKLEQ